MPWRVGDIVEYDCESGALARVLRGRRGTVLRVEESFIGVAFEGLERTGHNLDGLTDHQNRGFWFYLHSEFDTTYGANLLRLLSRAQLVYKPTKFAEFAQKVYPLNA